MRTREQIEEDISHGVASKKSFGSIEPDMFIAVYTPRILETLLDIRDLLSQEKPTPETLQEKVRSCFHDENGAG